MAYPIKYISFSSMKTFHMNPGGWKEKYILNNNTFKASPAMLVGKMVHAVIEAWLKGIDIQIAQEAQLVWLENQPDDGIKWGKTGNRQDVAKNFIAGCQMYFDEAPKYNNIKGIEHKMEYSVSDTIDGIFMQSPLPFLGIVDILYEEGGELIIEDFKVKVSHTNDEDGPHPSLWTQAIFYFYLVKAETGREPKEMRIREIKYGKNRDGSSQHNLMILNFKSEEFEVQKSIFWYQLMGMMKMIEDIDADSFLMYNTFDMLSGREAYEQLTQTQFGFVHNPKSGSDIVRVERAGIKETQFIEQITPDSIEGKIQFKFQEFGIALKFEERREGHAYDRYLFKPNRGVKMSDVRRYSDDVSQATALDSIRIIAPLPGTNYIAVEVPRAERKFEKHAGEIMPIGKDIDGKVIPFDLADTNTPHLIVAGRTGAGKSQFEKVLIESRPEGTLLYILDPKRVELSKYKSICAGYGCEPDEALDMLSLVKRKMDERYKIMENKGVSNIAETDYPRIMFIIDEWAAIRLDKTVGKECEDLVVQITNLGRAAGIHMILATQRPDAVVMSGRIKANIGARVCFATASAMDSQIVIEQPGAEKLAGKGDMLYLYPGQEPVRLQSFYI